MFDKELIQSILRKIQKALETILQRAETIHTSNDFLTTPSGVERLESICMLLIAIGESVKQIDKLTNKTWLTSYPEVDWKGVMGMRDIILITISILMQESFSRSLRINYLLLKAP